MIQVSTGSALILDPATKAQVLLSILQKNRDEITFWQNSLFTASFWFNTGILALVAFAFERSSNPALAYFVAFGILLLAIFHNLFASVAKSAVDHTGLDLVRIQNALLLTQTGEYLREAWIYTPGDSWLPQGFITWLRLLNILISLGGIAVLLVRAV